MSVEDLIGVYGTSYDALRLTTADSVEQLWLELGGPDDRRALEFAETALEVVNGAAVETAELVDGYVAEYVGTVTGRPPPASSPLDLGNYVVDELRHAAGLDVYRRPAITARAALADGKPFDEAMRVAGSRASSMAAADVGLAHRQASVDAMSANPDVDGYRRVLTGASCLLCMVASTQRYRTGELMPIHTRCDCRVAPLVDGTDYGRVVNRELYRELKSSGELARLNRTLGARGSGRARARQAAARRQGELEGIGRRGEQGELELRPPANARGLADELGAGAARRTAPVVPAVRQHGELGPVLVNDRHAYTRVTPSRAGDHRLDADLDELRRTDAPPPARVTTQRPPARPDEPATPPDAPPPPAPARKPRYTVDSPEVLRRSQRKNISPERAAEQLNARAARRSADQAAARKEARNLTVDSPQVQEVADKYGVTPEEVLVSRERVRELRRVIADEAAAVQARAFGDLDQWDALTVARPPRAAARSAMGRKLRGGEYDWLEGLDPRERARLSRVWFDDNPKVSAPDLVAQRIESNLGGDISSGDAVRIWLDRNRTIEAAGALRRGKLPSDRAYSGQIDPDTLLPEFSSSGYSATRVLGDDLDAAGHIAQVDRELMRRDAADYLGRALDPELGAAPYRMSFQSWEEEVRELEYAVREGLDAELRIGDDVVTFTADQAAERLEELVPYYLDEPGTSFEELYARIIVTAGRAGREVPSYARIPWS
jgi:hypothetical protein